MADAALHPIHPFANLLDHLVARIIDVIGVVTARANQRVRAGHAVEDIVAVVADDLVIQRIAGAVDVQAFEQAEFFNALVEQIIGAADDTVVTRVGLLQNAVVDAVDDISVIACAAFHFIRPRTAVQVIVA